MSIWGQKAEIDMLPLVQKELRLMGTFAYANDHAPVVELLKARKLDLDVLSSFITGRIAVEDVYEKGFVQLINNKEENVKILVHP